MGDTNEFISKKEKEAAKAERLNENSKEFWKGFKKDPYGDELAFPGGKVLGRAAASIILGFGGGMGGGLLGMRGTGGSRVTPGMRKGAAIGAALLPSLFGLRMRYEGGRDAALKAYDEELIPTSSSLQKIEGRADSKGLVEVSGDVKLPNEITVTPPHGKGVMDTFLKKLEAKGYNAPTVLFKNYASYPGAYIPKKNRIDFRGKEENLRNEVAIHEFTHYLDFLADHIKGNKSESRKRLAGGTYGELEENIEFGKRVYPIVPKGFDKGYLRGYDRHATELLARAPQGTAENDPYSLEDNLISQVKQSLEDILDKPAGMRFGSREFKKGVEGQHENILDLVQDIAYYHKTSDLAKELWENVPGHAYKWIALDNIKRGKEKLKEAGRERITYKERGKWPFIIKYYDWEDKDYYKDYYDER